MQGTAEHYYCLVPALQGLVIPCYHKSGIFIDNKFSWLAESMKVSTRKYYTVKFKNKVQIANTGSAS